MNAKSVYIVERHTFSQRNIENKTKTVSCLAQSASYASVGRFPSWIGRERWGQEKELRGESNLVSTSLVFFAFDSFS